MSLQIHNYSIQGIAIVDGISFDEAVGIAIRAVLDSKGATQKELSDCSGILPANLSKICSGKTSLTSANLLKISSCLVMSPSTLIDLACSIYTYPMNPDSKWVKQ